MEAGIGRNTPVISLTACPFVAESEMAIFAAPCADPLFANEGRPGK
jgi:hypothetical protein